MEDSFNFDDSEIKKIEIPKKEELKKESRFTKINNSYKEFMRKIKLGFIVDNIDKYFPSLILFVVLVLIILGVILFFVFYNPEQEFTINVYANNKLVNARLDFKDDVEIVNNKFKYLPNKSLTLNIFYNNENFEKRIITNNTIIRVDLDISTVTKKIVDKTFSFSLVSSAGLLNKNGILKLECDNYSKEFNFVNGILENVIVPCDAVNANVNVEGFPSINKMCGSGLCKIEMTVSNEAPLVQQNLSTNKLLVYVNNSNNTPAKDIEVSIRENNVTQALIDKGLTKEHGNYTFNLLEGEYIIVVNDLENKFASQTKNVIITAGPSLTEYFTLDLPNVGLLNLSFDVEDRNVLSGTIYLLDANDKLITQKDFNSNSNLEFGIKALGKYKISGILKSSFSSDYTIIEKELDFTKTQDLKIIIRKFNTFDYQRLVLQVIDSTTQKPIPNAKVYLLENKGSLSSTYIRNVGDSGILTADYNGVIKQILPIGSYIVKLNIPYLEAQTNFSISPTTSLTMLDFPIKLPVNWGSSLVNICLNEIINNKEEPLMNAFIEVFNKNDAFITSYYVNEKNCIDLSLRMYENVYFKITKDGYRELYTQDFFIHDKGNLNLKFNLTESVSANKFNKFDYEFLGAYSDVALKTKVSKLENADYYFAFKVNVPKANFNANNKLYFFSVVGDKKDENYLDSKLVIRNIYGLGYSTLYDNYFLNNFFQNENKIVSEVSESKVYQSKASTSIFDFSKFANANQDVELIYVVKAYVTKNAKKDDKIPVSFNFNLNDFSYDLKTVKFTFGAECKENLCLELWEDTTLLDSKSVVNISNFGALTANVEYSYDFKPKFAFFNSGLNENISKLEDIKAFDFFISEGESYLDGLEDSSLINLNNGPVYLYDFDIRKSNLLELDFNYNFTTNKNTKLNFSIYDVFSDAITEPINISSLNEDPLTVKFDTNYLVPFIENNLELYVEDKDENPIYSGEARYYYLSNGQWVLGDIYSIDLGIANLDILALPKGSKVKVVVDVPNYNLFVKEFVVDFTFLGLDKKIFIDMNAPNPEESIIDIVSMENKSNYDINVYNVNFTKKQETQSYWEDLLALDRMKDFFNNGSNSQNSIIEKNGYMQFRASYNYDYFSKLKVDSITVPISFSFYYLPNDALARLYGENLDFNYFESTSLDFRIKYDGAINKDCLILDILDDKLNSIANNNLVFLEENTKQLKLQVQNTCRFDGRLSTELKDLNLIVDSKLPYTINIFDTTLQGSNVSIPLDEAKVFSEMVYTYPFELYVDFDSALNSSFNNEPLNFELKANYYIANNLVETDQSRTKMKKTLNLDFNTFEKCISFGLDESKLNYDLDKYIIPNTDILRLPYYLKGELSEEENIVVNNLNIENANVPGKYVRNDAFEIDKLPLRIINNCGIDLEYSLEFNNNAIKLTNPLSLASIPIINSDNEELITFKRGDNFSGGTYLDLYVQGKDDSERYPNALVKSLKINVESSLGNKNFVENPFISEYVSNEQPVYYNEYYPENIEEIKNEAFNIDIPVCGISHATSETSDCMIHKTIVKKLPFALNDIFSNFRLLEFRDDKHFMYLFSTGIFDSDDPTTYNNHSFGFESNWFLFGNFGKQLNNFSCNGEDCSNDDYIWLRYYIYDKSWFNNINFDFDLEYDIIDLFKNNNLTISDSLFASKKFYYETPFENALRLYAKGLGNFINSNNPYFINYGWSTFYGDSRRDRYAHAPTYCPDNTEPVRIYLNTDYRGSIKNKYKKEYELFGKIEQKDGAFGFVHTLYVNLADNDADGYGYSKMLTVCRLLPEEFESNIDRPNGVKGNVNFIEEETRPMYLGFEESNCIYGGVTGENVAPKISFEYDVNCENLYCNNYQLGNYIINKVIPSDKNEFFLNNLRLMYDNYSEDAYNTLMQKAFLEISSGYTLKFNVSESLDLRLLRTGRYSAKVKVEDHNIIVDLFYNTYTLPDHLFYYMPYTKNAIVGNSLGTALNGVLNVNASDSYPLSNDYTPLFSYALNNNLKSVSANLPVVMKGVVNLSNNQGNGEIVFSDNNYDVKSLSQLNKSLDYEIELDIENTSYAHIWVKSNNKVYNGDLFFKIKEENDKLILEKRYDKFGFDENNIYLITVKSGNIASITDIINNIRYHNICYILKDNAYIYYWNINKILERV